MAAKIEAGVGGPIEKITEATRRGDDYVSTEISTISFNERTEMI